MIKFLAPPKVNVGRFQRALDSAFPGIALAVSAFYEQEGTILVIEGPEGFDFSGVEPLIKGISVDKTDQEETLPPADSLEQRLSSIESRLAALEAGKG